MLQLAHRCATVVAKWSRSPKRTCSLIKTCHRKPTDVLEISYGDPETSRELEKVIEYFYLLWYEICSEQHLVLEKFICPQLF